MLYLPWERCWYEYKVPDTMIKNGKIIDQKNNIITGIFARITEDFKKINFHVFSTAFLNILGDDFFYIGTNIRSIGDLSDKSPVVPNPKWILHEDKISIQEVAEICTRDVCNALYANMFTHCNNVDYYEKSHPEKLQKANIKRGKIPQETYRVLDIGGLTKQAKSEATDERGELQTALHICRGHFKTYTEENPLFGKITGTFWCPMHKRGSAKNGTVHKDYNIVTN